MFLSKINSIPFPFIKIHMLLDGIFVTLEVLLEKCWNYGY